MNPGCPFSFWGTLGVGLVVEAVVGGVCVDREITRGVKLYFVAAIAALLISTFILGGHK